MKIKTVFLWISWLLLCIAITLGLIFMLHQYLNPASPVQSEIINPSTDIPKEEVRVDPVIDQSVFKEHYEEAVEWMNTLTLKEKIGQLFFIRNPMPENIVANMEYQPGGLIMFARDFDYKEKEEVINNNAYYQSLSKIPLLIGVDEEGGEVIRVSRNQALVPTPFPSPQALYAGGGMVDVINDAKIKSLYLKELGINVNLAPVADIASDVNDYIYNRTIGLDSVGTSEYIVNVVRTMNQENMGATLKHFPGYGNNIDTHFDLAVDERDKRTFYDCDFLPFSAGIEANVPSILVSHNIVKAFDEAPASLSKKMHDVLREELKFTGVIMSDDLYMQAIKSYMNDVDPCIEAIKAGNDLLIVTDFMSGFSSLEAAVNNGEITEERINESVIRILAWKLQLGLKISMEG